MQYKEKIKININPREQLKLLQDVKGIYKKNYSIDINELFLLEIKGYKIPLLYCLKDMPKDMLEDHSYERVNGTVSLLADDVKPLIDSELLIKIEKLIDLLIQCAQINAIDRKGKIHLLTAAMFLVNVLRLEIEEEGHTFLLKEVMGSIINPVVSEAIMAVNKAIIKREKLPEGTVNALANYGYSEFIRLNAAIAEVVAALPKNKADYVARLEAEIKVKAEAEHKAKAEIDQQEIEEARKFKEDNRAKAQELAQPLLKKLNKLRNYIKRYNQQVDVIKNELQNFLGFGAHQNLSFESFKLGLDGVNIYIEELGKLNHPGNFNEIKNKIEEFVSSLKTQAGTEKERLKQEVGALLDRGKASKLKDFEDKNNLLQKEKEISNEIKKIGLKENQLNANFMYKNILKNLGKKFNVSFDSNFASIKIALNKDAKVSASKWNGFTQDIFDEDNKARYDKWKQKRLWEYFFPQRYKLRLDRAKVAEVAFNFAKNIEGKLNLVQNECKAFAQAIKENSPLLMNIASCLCQKISELKDTVKLQLRCIGDLQFESSEYGKKANQVKQELFKQPYDFSAVLNGISDDVIIKLVECLQASKNNNARVKELKVSLSRIEEEVKQAKNKFEMEISKEAGKIMSAVESIGESAEPISANIHSFYRSNLESADTKVEVNAATNEELSSITLPEAS